MNRCQKMIDLPCRVIKHQPRNEGIYFTDNRNKQICNPKKLIKSFNSKIIQLTDDNPYNMNDGKTSHHIIPHSLLIDIIKLLSTEQAKMIKKTFLPNLNNVTLRELHNLKIVKINMDNKVVISNKINDVMTDFLSKEGKDKPLGRDNIIYINSLIKDDNLKISNNNTAILDSYYEWQQGNQFNAIKGRAENGKSNEFDIDAKYFYDQKYVGELYQIYKELKNINDKNKFNENYKDGRSQKKADKKLRKLRKRISDQLKELSKLTKSTNAIPNDSKVKWIEFPKNSIQIFRNDFIPNGRLKNIESCPNIHPLYAIGLQKNIKEVIETLDDTNNMIKLLKNMNGKSFNRNQWGYRKKIIQLYVKKIDEKCKILLKVSECISELSSFIQVTDKLLEKDKVQPSTNSIIEKIEMLKGDVETLFNLNIRINQSIV